jgi:ubiquinone/menaquinone biosynthesis C-methylase UbiE
VGANVSLLDVAVCPNCRAAIVRDREPWACSACEASFPLDSGRVRALTSVDDDHKRAQAGFFDTAVDPEYEIVRPRGTPLFHRWMLREKFRRSIGMVSEELSGASVLTICGGSGLDAEFLSAAGARVLCTDISPGAARRAAVRSVRFGVEFEVAVADAEALPFPDRSFEFVYVHDGLHHLERPFRGVEEMARVAKRGVCITEPARAALTRVAVRLGISTNEEDAGNAVERLTEPELRRVLAAAGFRAQEASRYLMYYRHEPGLPARALSGAITGAAARVAFCAINAAFGRVGNKLTIQAVRT